MIRPEETRHPIAGVAVDEDSAKKSLFRLEIVRRSAEGRRLRGQGSWANQRVRHAFRLAKTGQAARCQGCEQWGGIALPTGAKTGALALGVLNRLGRGTAITQAKLALGGMDVVAGEREHVLVFGKL